ncbi:hypothetical protein ACFWEJ_26390 [Promicromonospora sp. NPDC060204]|uniref:hypothetical protein n=1 Tax=Promicromonospora sp. NPDC060204 TaxID=3347071 RepID=UPI003659431A
MDARKPLSGLYAPMPEVGTKKFCVFCREAVTLEQAASGWHYWTAFGDPVDGGRHCYGGTMGNVHSPALRTLHLPLAESEDLKWAWRYSPEGEGRLQ